jgi:hypothetical protein
MAFQFPVLVEGLEHRRLGRSADSGIEFCLSARRTGRSMDVERHFNGLGVSRLLDNFRIGRHPTGILTNYGAPKAGRTIEFPIVMLNLLVSVVWAGASVPASAPPAPGRNRCHRKSAFRRV